MSNRFCVDIEGIGLVPVNPEDEIGYFSTGRPERIGDDAIISLKYRVTPYGRPAREPVKVRLLRSENMVRNAEYLVDLESKEAWPFSGVQT